MTLKIVFSLFSEKKNLKNFHTYYKSKKKIHKKIIKSKLEIKISISLYTYEMIYNISFVVCLSYLKIV